MPRRALSKTKKAQLERDVRDQLYAHVVAVYLEEQSKPAPHVPLGFRKVCAIVSDIYMRETASKTRIHLNHATLSNLVKGRASLTQFNSQKSWLTPEETEQLISVLLELADWGQPCSYSRLHEMVNEILVARLGKKFPKMGVGKEWPARFVEKHSDRLHRYKARALDDVRSRAVNQTANDAWFDLVEDVQLRGDEGNPIAPECTWAMDETGFQPNGNEGCEYVIGGTGKKIQYQQRSGSRENVTVLVTIGANGTALRPLVLYSGKGFLENWLQDNPSKASLAYSKKGWTNNELGVDFDFINYCRLNQIKVPKYIPHGTHVYQGLDVVVFSPVKQNFGHKRDTLFRETGQHVSKENFLSVYGQVHTKTITPALVKEAFRKTGIVPVDHTVITPQMLAPSKEDSHQAITPIIPPTPVRKVTEYLIDVLPLTRTNENPATPSRTHSTQRNPAIAFRTQVAVNELKDTSTAFIFGNSPVKSSSEPPDLPTLIISPSNNKDSIQKLLAKKPKTYLEQQLHDALEESQATVELWKTRTVHLQSALVLQRLYCRRVRVQLKAKEAKASKTSNRRLRNPNIGIVLTHKDYFQEVKKQRDVDKAAKKAKEQRQTAQEKLAEAVVKWEAEECERLEANKAKKEALDLAKVNWREEKAKAKANKIKVKDWIVTHPEPRQADPGYQPSPKKPKPTLAQFLEEEGWEDTDNDDESSIDDGEGDESDESEN